MRSRVLHSFRKGPIRDEELKLRLKNLCWSWEVLAATLP